MENIKLVKSTTKKGQHYLDLYERSNDEELEQVYGRCSLEKVLAYEDCRAKCRQMNGTGFKIISHCRTTFTIAYWINEGLYVDTGTNEYLITGVFPPITE